jgi:N-acetylglutamate synthase-like GNAT family acetyltransferase
MDLIEAERVSEEIQRKCCYILSNYWGGTIENRYESLFSSGISFILLKREKREKERQEKERERETQRDRKDRQEKDIDRERQEKERERQKRKENEEEIEDNRLREDLKDEDERKEEINESEIDEQIEVIGHVKLNSVQSSDDIFGSNLCGIVTSVIIDQKYRGLGYGTILMNLLETKTKEKGYCYLYLWTNDATKFYLSLGYQVTERVTEFVNAFRTLESTAITKLEHMLAAKLNQVINPHQTIEAKHNDLPTIYLKKRIREEFPLQVLPMETWISSFRHEIEHFPFLGRIRGYWNILRWSPQIGPSCGLQASRFCLDYYQPESSFSRSLLQLALRTGYTRDGEMFDITHLHHLITLSLSQSQIDGLNVTLSSFSSLSWQKIVSILSSNSEKVTSDLDYPHQ